MQNIMTFLRYLVLSSAFLLSNTQPVCRTVAVRDIVCTAGRDDFILSKGLVSNNNKTTGITLRACRITDIDYEAFDQLPFLEYLDLSVNKIKNLKLGVLDEFQQLKLLNLSQNQISTFPLGLFDQKPNLEVLDLKGNRIDTLELGIFDPMTKLRYVDVSSNRILGRNINPNIFDQSPRIMFIDFSNNDMSNTPDNMLQAFQAMNFLNLDSCSLTEVPKFARASNLSSMKHLMLSRNKITSIEDLNTFSNLANLEILNLVGNSIERIKNDVFKPLKKLKIVMLSYNKIKTIPDTLFQNLPKLSNIDLSHNLIEYVPVNAFRGSPIKNLNLSDNRFTYLIDNFCLELKNSGAKLTKFYFNQNPWQCACLRDILEEVKSQGIAYNDVKYDGKESVCVTGNEFNCKRQMDANDYFNDMYYNNKL